MNAILIFGYLAFLGLALLAPFLTWSARANSEIRTSGLSIISGAGIAGAAIVLFARDGLIFQLAPLLLVPLVGRGRSFLIGGGVGLLLFAPTIWWPNDPRALPLWQWIPFAALVLSAGLAVRLNPASIANTPSTSSIKAIPAFLGAVTIALGIGWLTAPFNVDTIAHTAWHHWGAYLSPVDLLLSGGIPYRDFSVQYGVGPTLLLAGACGNDCWSGMFNVVLVTNALYFGILAACVAIITEGMPWAMRLLSLAAMFCATMLWTAFPAEFGTAMATPSAVALRFLPLTLQILFILSCEKNPQKRVRLGHAIWLLNSFWSIEAAVFASALWWPWLALREHQRTDGKQSIVPLLARYAFIGGIALLGSATVMLAMFRLNFGVWPEPVSVFAYFQNPPGPLRPNPIGPLGLIVMLVILAIRLLSRGEAKHKGMLYACLITMLAAFSYYLSRSHDNNILNLLPFVLLVALCILSNRGSDSGIDSAFSKGFVTMIVMSTVAFVATFNFLPWTEIARNGKLMEAGPNVLLRQFSPPPSDPNPIISRDALELIDLARRSSPYTPVLFDKMAVMPHAEPGKAWTNINNIANYSFLPRQLVNHYILQGAKTYKRPGWLIVEDGRYERWPEYFTVAYDVEPVVRKGRYVAYVLQPKLQTGP